MFLPVFLFRISYLMKGVPHEISHVGNPLSTLFPPTPRILGLLYVPKHVVNISIKHAFRRHHIGSRTPTSCPPRPILDLCMRRRCNVRRLSPPSIMMLGALGHGGDRGKGKRPRVESGIQVLVGCPSKFPHSIIVRVGIPHN